MHNNRMHGVRKTFNEFADERAQCVGKRIAQFRLTPCRDLCFEKSTCSNWSRNTNSFRSSAAGPLTSEASENLRTVQILLGHTKLESTVRYLGIEVDDALEISEQTEI